MGKENGKERLGSQNGLNKDKKTEMESVHQIKPSNIVNNSTI